MIAIMNKLHAHKGDKVPPCHTMIVTLSHAINNYAPKLVAYP